MSRNFAVLGKAGPALDPSHPAERETPPGPYTALINHLFAHKTALALVGASSTPVADDPSIIALDLAKELGRAGKRVVLVPVSVLLRLNPIPVPSETSFRPSGAPLVWIWPSQGNQSIEFFHPSDSFDRRNWLKSLRERFDAVLLDCQHVEEEAGTVEVASLAESAVLVVKAGVTSKQTIQRDKSALQLRGVTVAGSILVHDR